MLTLHFNRFIRSRDKEKPCISCGKGPAEQAGHYYSTSQCPHPSMRFNAMNVHGQCFYCNYYLEGNRQGYREGLIKRYGEKVIQDLDVCRSLKQNPWTRFEYMAMIERYKRKLEKGLPI